MNGITVGMALVDFLPVLMFFTASVILQRDFYNKMVKGAFALLATGSILVLLSGFYKAIWKILYALNICDFPVLSDCFFALQAPGFFLIFASLISILARHGKGISPATALSVVPVYNSNMIFIVIQTLGCAGVQWCLFAIAKHMKKRLASLLFVLSFISMLCMGYLSAKFDDSASMHWIAQLTNIISQGSLLYAVWILHKAGLDKENILS